jgi:hypothetical protein
MKWLLYLFALYILILPCIPCNANDLCCADKANSIATPNQQRDHSDQSDHHPVCPCCPFLACNTFHGIVLPDTNIEFDKAILALSVLRSNYTTHLPYNFPSAIWQPPKTA